MPHYFPSVTLLITHYNRSRSLERLLESFRMLGFVFGEIVVSDDASKPEHQQVLATLQNVYNFRLVTAPVNKGLANNLNKGQAAVKTPLTLYVQEDFIPKPAFIEKCKEAVSIMEAEPAWDFVRFYAYLRYPYLKPYRAGFSEMLFKLWYTDYHKIYLYSDHPHLRRSSFNERFGKYVEGIKSDKAEYLMCVSVLQHKPKALFYEDFKGLFDQVNSSDEPSTVTRDNWRQQSRNPFVAVARYVYRQLKYNYDLL